MMQILLADDDAPVRAVLREILESTGFAVVEVDNGAAALRVCQTHPPAMIICDLFMPGTDGLEVIQALRRTCPTLPILAISGGGVIGTRDLLQAARHLGAAAVLAKPFDRTSLLETVQHLIGNPTGGAESKVTTA